MNGFLVPALFGPQIEKFAAMQRVYKPPFQAVCEAATAPLKAQMAALPRPLIDNMAAVMESRMAKTARMPSQPEPVTPEPMAGRV